MRCQQGRFWLTAFTLTADQVRLASDAGCWFVQNPRSNKNNRVGYPSGLTAGRRVALGTDGFASDMEDEARALAECSADAGESPTVVGGRLGAGWGLVEDLFGGTVTRTMTTDVPSDDEMATLEEDAREQARRLWERW